MQELNNHRLATMVAVLISLLTVPYNYHCCHAWTLTNKQWMSCSTRFKRRLNRHEINQNRNERFNVDNIILIERRALSKVSFDSHGVSHALGAVMWMRRLHVWLLHIGLLHIRLLHVWLHVRLYVRLLHVMLLLLLLLIRSGGS